jgi:hypothetical protein
MGDTTTILLTLVGIGVIVVGVLLLVQLRSGPEVAATRPAETVVVREVRGPRFGRRYPYGGPFYSHLPYRPLMY